MAWGTERNCIMSSFKAPCLLMALCSRPGSVNNVNTHRSPLEGALEGWAEGILQ